MDIDEYDMAEKMSIDYSIPTIPSVQTASDQTMENMDVDVIEESQLLSYEQFEASLFSDITIKSSTEIVYTNLNCH